MHSILRQQAAQFVAVGGCGCRVYAYCYCKLLLQNVSIYTKNTSASRGILMCAEWISR